MSRLINFCASENRIPHAVSAQYNRLEIEKVRRFPYHLTHVVLVPNLGVAFVDHGDPFSSPSFFFEFVYRFCIMLAPATFL